MEPSSMVKDKTERFGAVGTASSPRSPFQFGPFSTASPKSPSQFRGLSRTLSYISASTTSSAETDIYEDDQQFVVNGSHVNIVGSPSLNATYHTLDGLHNSESHLRPAMRRALELQVAMHESHARVMGIMNRVSLLSIAVAPLSLQSIKAKRVEEHLGRATEPAKASLRMFNSMQKLRGVLCDGPVDVGHYIESLSQFEQEVEVTHLRGPMIVEALEDGVSFLNGRKLVDSFHLEELYEVVQTLQSLLAGQEHLVVSGNMIDEALGHLVAAFARIMCDYCKPIDLPHSLLDVTEKVNQKPPRALPEPVLQLLQAIAEKLALHNRLDDCLEVYDADRGEKLKESLRDLPLSSYLCYQTSEAINLVEWMHLEEHIAMWTRHLSVFVDSLLDPEHRFCQKVFSNVKADLWKDFFGRMAMEVGLGSFIGFGEAVTKSQREPQKLFKLLDMYDCLEKLKPNLRAMFNGGGPICKDIKNRLRCLHKTLVRGIAGILKEMKHQVEVQEEGKKMMVHRRGGVLKLVSYMVNYLKYMLSDGYKPLISSALKAERTLSSIMSQHTLGKMKNERETDTETEDEGQQLEVLAMMVLEIMQAIDKNIAKTAEMLVGVPAYASFFLMNNYSYIYTRCDKSEVGALLGKEWVQKQLDKMELCAMQYKQEAWGQLIAIVNCEGVSTAFSNVVSSETSAGRELIRQRARAFHVSLENLAERHSTWFIPYEVLRQRIYHDVLQSVVPAYRSFLQTYSHFLLVTQHGPQVNPLKDAAMADQHLDHEVGHGSYGATQDDPTDQLDPSIIKYTPDTVGHMLTSIFEMKFQPQHLHHLARKTNPHAESHDTSSTPSLSASAATSDYDSDILASTDNRKTISSKKFRLKLSRRSRFSLDH